MKIPRLPPATWPPPPTVPPRPVPAAGSSAAAAPGAVPAPLDTAAGLRIFVEEVRLAVVEQLGRRAGLLAPAVAEEGPAEAAARLLTFLRAASGAAGGREPAAVVEVLREAVAVGAQRALAATAARPGGAAPGVAIAIEESRAQVAAVLPKSRPPDVPARAAQLLVEQVRAAVEERLGMLPRGLAVESPEGPAEAMAAVGRLFRAVANDPVLAVRASPFAMAQALEQGAARASALLAGGSGAEAARIVSDLRAVLAREVTTAAGVRAPLPGGPQSALSALANEVRLAVAESGAPRPVAVDEALLADPRAALGSLVRTLAEAAQQWSITDPRASRAAAEATLDVALRRTLLQLPAADRQAAEAVLREVHADATRLLLAAELAVARGASPSAWARPALEAATALLKGLEPPFRFDLAALPAARLRRRRTDRGNPDGIEAIESSDPDETDDPEPLEWPRLPE